MTATQKDLLENGLRVDELRASYAKDSALNEPFIVQTIGSSAIASAIASADANALGGRALSRCVTMPASMASASTTGESA